VDDKTIHCSRCGSQVSSPVFAGTQIRAFIECYDCHKTDTRVAAIRALLVAIQDAAIAADWTSANLAEAVEQAEKCLAFHHKP
jgi:hypothetical protein